MTITLDAEYPIERPYCHDGGPKHDGPCRYILCISELPTFCRLLLKHIKPSYVRNFRNTTIHVEIDVAIWKGDSKEIDRSPVGLSRLQRLLDPLHRLYGFSAAQVEGPMSSSYKRGIIEGLCKDPPTAIDIIETATRLLNQGDEQVRQTCPFRALQIYKDALAHVRSCSWSYNERYFIMERGPFSGLKLEQVQFNLKNSLRARIASLYLSSGMSRMAQIYVERAHYSTEYPNRLQPWQYPVFAEVFHVSAQICHTKGDIREAIEQICQAGEYIPLNEEQQCRLDAWEKHMAKIAAKAAKRYEFRRLRRQKRELNEGIEPPKKCHNLCRY